MLRFILRFIVSREFKNVILSGFDWHLLQIETFENKIVYDKISSVYGLFTNLFLFKITIEQNNLLYYHINSRPYFLVCNPTVSCYVSSYVLWSLENLNFLFYQDLIDISYKLKYSKIKLFMTRYHRFMVCLQICSSLK